MENMREKKKKTWKLCMFKFLKWLAKTEKESNYIEMNDTTLTKM